MSSDQSTPAVAPLELVVPLARERWAGTLGRQEYALLALSLGAMVLIRPVLHCLVFAMTAAAVYWIGSMRLARNQKLLLVLSVLLIFIAIKQQSHRPPVFYVLWDGAGLEAFFVLRCIDWAISKRAKDLSDRLPDRVGRYLLYLFFFPTLFAGPVITYNDFYRSRRPAAIAPFAHLRAHLAKILWGAVKFYLSYFFLRQLLVTLRASAEQGQLLFGVVDPWIALWCYVALSLIALYLAFSGFSDMALGVSRILGFQLYENFNKPLLAPSPTSYWKRNHISAYRWLMTHVFYPYWGHAQVTLKILTTFFASAVWHLAIAKTINLDAAAQLFLAFGLYGVAVVATVRLGATVPGRMLERIRASGPGPAVMGVQIALTFAFTALVHQIFRAGLAGQPMEQTIKLFHDLLVGMETT